MARGACVFVPYSLAGYFACLVQLHGYIRQVRCSLDTELCLALEPVGPRQWKREGPLQHFRQVTQFPHAVLELKLQLSAGTVSA